MSARDVIAGCLKQLRRPGARTTDAGDAAFVTAALAAAGYVVERGWQPIESAPRDRCVLLWWPTTTNSPVIGRFDSGIWMTDWGRLSVPHDSPSHWRRLPDPPAAEAEAKEASDGQ